MKKENKMYGMPNVGCMIGTAYQCLVGQLDEILREELPEVTVPEYMILRSLYFRDGMQQCDIAEMVGRDKAVVCRTVKAMVSKGYVRTESESHKCLRVFLTSKAESVKAKVLQIAAGRQKALESVIGPECVSVFSDCLKKIIESK
ncbi:MAG: MarR family transcriptional regulator [Muribaculaceae bacterium]|nr:MarR family transcriptional regulator [Muribaculaceae bacterium]